MSTTRSDTSYQPLLADADDGEKGVRYEEVTGTLPVPSTVNVLRKSGLWVVLLAHGLLTLVLAVALLRKEAPNCPINPVYPQVLYSPAQEALEYEPKTFSMGFGSKKTIYQGPPSNETDKAWDDLYNRHGLSKIPKWQARLLPNKTLPIPGDEEYYAVGLAVFHQLHCLNIMRKGLSPEYYTDPVTGAIAGIPKDEWSDHLSHCVDNIRQSLMCASDISLVVWQWVEADQRASIMMNTAHSCRNFDRIVDWAKAHKRDRHFDMHVHVEDDIEIPVF
ncbi:hypothetical protein K474DRAFT_1603983 [Panus rudis PR-1116 ss-1]|nr:hypothetical protein K474DRAFT_1603983 [Panus rudis PR-1116 ss-1]